MGSDIIISKLFKPPITKDILYRKRLVEPLLEGLEKPLTIISAPAGYGKSLLASSWLEEMDCSHGWISLNENDNDLTTFLSSIEQCLKITFKETNYSFKTLTPSSILPDIKEIGKIFINNLGIVEGPLVLVFDDYHLINNLLIHEFLDFVLKHCPPQLKICLVSRTEPEIKIKRLNLYNKMNFLGAKDLLFQKDEIQQLFQSIKGTKINSDQIKNLISTTEGWIIGLRLFMHAIDQEVKDNSLNFENKEQSLIEEYLINEVLRIQPVWVRRGLLVSSVLTRFNKELIQRLFNVLLEDEDRTAQEFITYLKKKNLFVIALDKTDKWFRYHHLFGELLIHEQKREYKLKEIEKIFETTYRWYEEEGYASEAIEYAMAINHRTSAVAIVEKNWREQMNKGEWHVLVLWLSKFSPLEIQSSAQLVLAQSWQYYYHYNIEAVAKNLDLLEILIQGKDILVGERALFLGYVKYFLNRPEESHKSILLALKHIEKSDVEFRSQSEILYGLSSQMLGKMEECLGHIKAWLAEEYLNPLRKACILWAWAFNVYMDGELDEAAMVAEELEEFSRSAGIENFLAWGLYLQGLVFLQKGSFEKAVMKLRMAEEYKYAHFARGAIDSLGTLSLCYGLMGNFKEAQRTLHNLDNFNEVLGSIFTDFTQQVSNTILYLRGETDSVKHKLAEMDFPADSGMMSWFLHPCVLHCELLIKEGSTDNLAIASNYLDNCMTLNKKNNNLLQLIPLLVLKSCLLIKTNNSKEALNYLRKAISLNPDLKIKYPFIIHFEEIASLLHLIPSSLAPESFKNDLARVHNEIVNKKEEANKSKVTAHLKVFSFRELEIMECLSRGARNKEIAKKLFISENTVKKHITSIFSKLNVHTRKEAVIVFSELD